MSEFFKKVNFAMINTQISPLLTKESHHQWVLQQVANNEWKIMRSEIKLLYMIRLKVH